MKQPTALAALWSATALACSGPGAAEAIQRSGLLGSAGLVVSAVCTIAIGRQARRRRTGLVWAALVVALTLLLGHPGFWVSPSGGDCGHARLVFTAVVVALHLTLAALVHARRPTAG